MIDFFAAQPIAQTALNVILSAILAFILSFVYIRCGTSLSNRRVFARNFYLIAMTITIIITVVKSSLALSLGLVGALSIVRYRAAIKEPEELAYLFVTIAVGLGIGAGQQVLTVIAFVLIVIVILLHHLTMRRRMGGGMNYNLSLVVPKSGGSGEVSLEKLLTRLQPHCTKLQVKRYEDNGELLDASMCIEYKEIGALDKIGAAIRELHPDAKTHFLDSAID